MPRRAAAATRPIEADSVHGSRLVQQVINKVMTDGKKSTAEKIVYDALDILSRRTNNEPVPALEESIKILTPVLEVRSRRVGGATYQVPVEVPQRRARTLAVRWLIEFARNRREKSMAERLAGAMAWGAGIGGSRPAAVTLAVVGVAVLAWALLVDLPETNETGVLGQNFEGATAAAEAGLTIEIVAGALALAAGAVRLLAPARE